MSKNKINYNEMSLEELRLLLKTSSWYKRISIKSKLSKEKKKALQDYLEQYKEESSSDKQRFDEDNIFEILNLNLWYMNGKKQALFDLNLNLKRNKVTALIGPSGCGKSTFLRCLNRINETMDGVVIDGKIYLDGKNIYSKKFDPLSLRTKVGLVFQKPTPFTMSIYDNVAFAPRNFGIKDKAVLDKIVEDSLRNAALWDEVKDELDKSALDLSGGQQQRLCLARTLALNPEVILMDEPTSALDPIATSKIENLILKLKEKYTIIIVTHSMKQAQRVSDETIFFYKGKIIEHDSTRKIFTYPQENLTKDYLYGKL